MATFAQEEHGYSLNATDRCDRCSARAAVGTLMPGGGILLWCAHHYDENEAALTAGGAVVVADGRKD
ncbi:DUF7455 domain-containing protein [Jatrophihabitans lederbergiae]|jgi:hypothetical protein|uniref:DUF7455 domain-containing protein n=1 Tax=Jatrophihabitans lederbergiae TaxID=3075547 RepID=A0ABU2JCH3_9ACTN|nr:hypothetical protein [Jatrophihabitans sp. DSM 44399]MDT0262680.1 hypothetical protein [Jatrophihabitans sp. DSM 44399]